MKFRLYILKDPQAKRRGYSLKGIKIPLRSFCPIQQPEGLLGIDDKPVKKGKYSAFWKVSTEDLIVARPALEKHLKRIDALLLPVEWCDVAPIERWEEAWQG